MKTSNIMEQSIIDQNKVTVIHIYPSLNIVHNFGT
jgi:hypothetical protein